MRLRSKRVYLRAPVTGDFAELAELYMSSRAHFRGYADANYRIDRFQAVLRDADSETTKHFLICQTTDAAIAGTLTLSQIFRKSFQNAYLGYQLFAGFTGKGLMTEAVATALRYAFTELGLHRIEANVQPSNSPSIRVLSRNGFTKEGFSRRYLKIGGRWRDHERWAILKEDWMAIKENGRNGTESI